MTVETIIHCGELDQCLPEFRKWWFAVERQPVKEPHSVPLGISLHALCLLATTVPKPEADRLDEQVSALSFNVYFHHDKITLL